MPLNFVQETGVSGETLACHRCHSLRLKVVRTNEGSEYYLYCETGHVVAILTRRGFEVIP